MSKAVNRFARVSATISVLLSGVITIPLGNHKSFAAILASPDGETRTKVVPLGSSLACLLNPKLPMYAPPFTSTTISLHQ